MLLRFVRLGLRAAPASTAFAKAVRVPRGSHTSLRESLGLAATLAVGAGLLFKADAECVGKI